MTLSKLSPSTEPGQSGYGRLSAELEVLEANALGLELLGAGLPQEWASICRQVISSGVSQTAPWNGQHSLEVLPLGPGVVLIWHDLQAVSQQQLQLTRHLEEARETLAFALQAADLGTFHCPMPLGVMEWSDICKQQFYLPIDLDVDFDMFLGRVHPGDQERVREAVERAIRESGTYDIKYRIISPEGDSRWIRARGRTLFDANGNPTRFDGITMDVTPEVAYAEERQALLLAEQSARFQAERSSRLKDEFLATLSHELRTPLASVLGWAQILRATEVSELADITEGLSVIERNARVQLNLIEDLLDVSRLVTGRFTLDLKPVNLVAVVDAAMETVETTATARGVRLLRSDRIEDAAPVRGDAARLQQVVWNLLSNAIKFTPAGGEVEVSVSRPNGHFRLSVQDTGSGIKPDVLPHIFDRFRQQDSSTTRRYGGLGLGLALVKQLVELHGGLVSAHNRVDGSGAIFTVVLPTENSGETTLTPVIPSIESHPVLHPEVVAGLTVVNVDDDADLRDLVSRMLTNYGVVVWSASCAEEALELVESKRPDLLLSDIGMPNVDGYALIEQLRSRPTERGGATPAAAVTAFARPEDRERALRAGFQAHLAKPVELAQLIVMVATLGGRHHPD